MRIRMQGAHPTEDDPSEHRTLAVGETYFVIGVSRKRYRVIDDRGEPILFPKDIFEVLDRSIPPGWQMDDRNGDDYYLQPIAVSQPGFFEHWHDPVDPEKHATARRVMRETLEQMRAGVDETDRALIDRDSSRLRVSDVPRVR